MRLSVHLVVGLTCSVRALLAQRTLDSGAESWQNTSPTRQVRMSLEASSNEERYRKFVIADHQVVLISLFPWTHLSFFLSLSLQSPSILNMASKNVYATDHAESVLSTHRWRTLENSAAYVLPYLKPGMKILDVGCGPGSITTDLAKHVPDGRVTGIEIEAGPLQEAQRFAEAEGVSNVKFETGDIHDLKYEDETFDMVHVHQVLQHVADPVKALSEMRRVVKVGGIVACRESAIATWYPESEGLTKGNELMRRIATSKGGNPHPGNHIHVWAHQAGFGRDQITCSTGTWCFRTPEERAYWGGGFAQRTESSGFARNAVEGNFATREELSEIAEAWRAWVRDDDGWFSYLHGQIICER